MSALEDLIASLTVPLANPGKYDDDIAVAIDSLTDFVDRQSLAICEVARAINNLADAVRER